MQITNASQMVKLENDPHAAFALIIDGKTLTYILEDDMKHQFLNLAVDCASVICCRVSPKQKALVLSWLLTSDLSLSSEFWFSCKSISRSFLCSLFLFCFIFIWDLGNKISQTRHWKNHISYW